jgi:hypothetical protein
VAILIRITIHRVKAAPVLVPVARDALEDFKNRLVRRIIRKYYL